MSINSSEILQLFLQVNQLSKLLEADNGDERWKAFQDWQANNPKYKKQIDHCVKIKPSEAVDYLAEEFEIDLNVVALFDPKGAMLNKIERLIETIQTLYKERQGA
ncbi:MAG: hypothetical protein KGJ13_05715 [Patescibacteria group bacterium]|nr:hypothetical protein [Patescibacteria group bacterium]